jgi:hypothetical protein
MSKARKIVYSVQKTKKDDGQKGHRGIRKELK